MNSRLRTNGAESQRWFLSLFLFSWLALISTGPLLAQEHYLPPGHPDGVALLAPPPAAGSEEAAADLATARKVFKHRTHAEELRANKDAGLSLFLFAPAIGDDFKPGKFPKVEELFNRVKAEIGDPINAPKNYWKRQRPYQVDPRLSLGKPEDNYSYPSGHSTRGTVYSLMMAEIFPEKRDAILAIGRDIGWDRVLIGKHFPTDVQAGRVLGQAIFRELMASPAFQRDLADAKAEAHQPQAAAVVGKP
jgi:acid phosphatase (class A)